MKLSDTEMRLMMLGAALVGVSDEGSRICAAALEESQRIKRKAAAKTQKKAKRRPKR